MLFCFLRDNIYVLKLLTTSKNSFMFEPFLYIQNQGNRQLKNVEFFRFSFVVCNTLKVHVGFSFRLLPLLPDHHQ